MGALMILLSMITTVTSIWMAVSFVLYLFKDEPFSWASVWITVGGLVSIGLLFIWMLANDKY
jgi:hypothetical protein